MCCGVVRSRFTNFQTGQPGNTYGLARIWLQHFLDASVRPCRACQGLSHLSHPHCETEPPRLSSQKGPCHPDLSFCGAWATLTSLAVGPEATTAHPCSKPWGPFSSCHFAGSISISNVYGWQQSLSFAYSCKTADILHYLSFKEQII